MSRITITIDLDIDKMQVSTAPIVVTETATQEPEPEAPSVQAQETGPADEPVETPAAPATTEEVLDDDWLRGCIDLCRDRIEGVEWRTDPSSERPMKYHKQLNAVIKQAARDLARTYGDMSVEITKPTELPPYMRQAFAKTLDDIYVNDKGEIDFKAAF